MSIIDGKVAIVTLYDEVNIGNKLQNFALQEILKKYFPYVETIKYVESSPIVGWKGKLAVRLNFPKKIALEKKLVMERWDRFHQFSNIYLKTTNPISYKKIDATINDRYRYFIVGSDQVWHNFSNTMDELNYFLLSFADEKKRICFAPSFGLKELPQQYIKRYKEELSKYAYLSCREKDGCVMIKELLNRDAELLPDPTMVLPTSEWTAIEKKPNYKIPEDFILAYFLGPKTNLITEELSELSNTTKMPIIDILNPLEREHYLTRPDEFIYLVRRARYVCTNSFHGSVFSILYRKRFKIYGRNDNEGKKMSSRISGLIDEFSLLPENDGFFTCNEHNEEVLMKKRELVDMYFSKVLKIKN